MLSRKAGTNLVLAIVVMVLSLFVYLEPGREEPVDAPLLTPLLASDIQVIELQAGSAAPIRLRQTGGQWSVVTPIQVAANQQRVDVLLAILKARVYAQFARDERALAVFGLDQPGGSIRLNDLNITFGDTEPLHHRRYAMVADHIYLIDDRYYYQSQLLLTALVDNSLLSDKTASITRISLPGLDVSRGETKVGDGASYSVDQIVRFMDRWQHAQALQVSQYDSDPAGGQIEVWLDNGETIAFDILADGLAANPGSEMGMILGRKDVGLRYHFGADQAAQLVTISPTFAANRADEVTSGPRINLDDVTN